MNLAGWDRSSPVAANAPFTAIADLSACSGRPSVVMVGVKPAATLSE